MELQKAIPKAINSESELIGWLPLIGCLTIYWTPVERSIDQCVHLIHTHWGGDSICPKKPKISLVRKMEFLEKCHDKIPALKNNADHVKKLIEATEYVSEIRNVLVHGLIVSWTSNEIKIGKLKADDKFIVEIYAIDFAKIKSSVSILDGLASRWDIIAALLLDYQRIEAQKSMGSVSIDI